MWQSNEQAKQYQYYEVSNDTENDTEYEEE